jgi:hypothetical protein
MPRNTSPEKSLLALFPSVAAQADGWDPSKLPAHSHQKMTWKCNAGHKWETAIYNRTSGKKGCPYCSGRFPIVGINDLQTKNPSIASEAFGWDPSQYTCGSGQKKEWLCQCGYKWLAQICKRTNGRRGCPRCAGKVITLGKNDLASQYPRIASEACDWNPQEVSRMSDKVLKWKCAQGHEWMASVKNRTLYDSQCPVCIRKIFILGVNDLASQFPSIAAEAHGWDPSQVRYGSDKKKEWKCQCGNIFIASPNNRTNPSNGTSCPCCAEYGYKPSKPAWLYLVSRDGEQKVGISNVPKTRLATHRSHGFTLLELLGPMDGFRAKEIESTIKGWIKNKGIVIEGTQENWRTDDMLVSSLLDLGQRAGLDQSSLELLS